MIVAYDDSISTINLHKLIPIFASTLVVALIILTPFMPRHLNVPPKLPKSPSMWRYSIKHDDRLMERSFGDFEGQVVESWADLVENGVNIDDYNLDQIAGNVEPVKNMLARVKDFLSTLRNEYPDDAQILIVAHGAISKAFD